MYYSLYAHSLMLMHAVTRVKPILVFLQCVLKLTKHVATDVVSRARPRGIMVCKMTTDDTGEDYQ